MWTNVFKIGSLRQISWFQFLPHDAEINSLPDKSEKVDQKDAATHLVLLSHHQLQKEGFLSTWTNCFVGPWDPSQGLHNPDDKIKLWLFIPGHHSSVVDKAQSAVSKLRVLVSGLWVAPGDSEEVAAALSQALKNCIERGLRGLSYMRFGDVFSRYYPFSETEEVFRQGQPVVEFIFAATEEAIFVHVIISSKYIRALSSSDIERVLQHSPGSSTDRLPVIVSPHGMLGKLTGCCPSDLVKQVSFSSGKLRASNGIVGLPGHVSQGTGCQLRGQHCYAEVSVGCSTGGKDSTLRQNVNSNSQKSFPKHYASVSKVNQKGSTDQSFSCQRVFIYPSEAVLVPTMQTSSAKSYLKRFWLQNWIGPSFSGSSFLIDLSDSKVDSKTGSWPESSIVRSQRGYRSSSNSNSSSISSITCSTSDSDNKVFGAGELEADADSLTCGPSGSSSDQLQSGTLKPGSKRSLTESYSQTGAVANPHAREYGSVEVGHSAIAGLSTEQLGWDDDDRGMGMDIQALLSEFGDFGDFFENDALPFGEPPGTAESQALMLPAADSLDMGSSPTSLMEMSDQMLLPVTFSSFDGFNPSPPPPPALMEDPVNKGQEFAKNSAISSQDNYAPAYNSGESERFIKAEALMTFAPEYGAVETPASELSSIFRNPYVPNSRKAESTSSSSNSYVYSAIPPATCFNGSEEKSGGKYDTTAASQSRKYYTHVESAKQRNGMKSCNGDAPGSSVVDFLGFKSPNAVGSVVSNINEGQGECGRPSLKSVLATEVECHMCQAFMCRIRHTLLSSSSSVTSGMNRVSGSTLLNQLHPDQSIMADSTLTKLEVKKKESIPARLAGNVDGGVLDGPLNAPVGVWRSVGAPKVAKSTTANMEICPPVTHNSFIEESMMSYGLRQPLQELLDGMALLVQQATSFVDVALDSDSGDGPYGWLALQEQLRRGFSCGPSMVHAGCGGVLASCHSLDVAGVELVDPLLADVQASSVISLLQSDVKAALKSAFGTVDGPLSIIDWCRGRCQSNDSATPVEGISAESAASASECRDSSSTVTFSVGDPISPSQSSVGGSSCLKDGTRLEEASERRSNQEPTVSEAELQPGSRLKPTLAVVPFPAILVGYQDDWLKTSASALQVWEKAPFEPYAAPKHITYQVVCPDIDPLTTAATDFFQQLGVVYDTCKLGTHSPQSSGNEMEVDSGKSTSSGFVLLNCPQSMKIDSSNASMLGSISDYFLSLSNGWDLTSFLKSLSKALKALKLSPCTTTSLKEGNNGPCTVIYVVCPFPEPLAVLQTIVESSVALGSVIFSSDKERRSMMHNQIGKALSYSAAVDEALSHVLTISGFSVPKLVLQIVTVDAIFRVSCPPMNELVILKEIAFTVYNKARRISRGSSSEVVPSSSISSRSHSMLMQMTSPVQGMWKECVGPRIVGPSLQREGELDASLRSGTWENSWQASRAGPLGCDTSRMGDFLQDDTRCMFEPLFILAEPGSVDRGVPPPIFGNLASDSSKLLSDDGTSGTSGVGDMGPSSQPDALEADGFGGSAHNPPPSLHCCYGWTEDWRWLVCIWTDSRGELLDSYIYPFGGISSRQDTKGLQSLFVQILQQGCQILQACPDASISKPRDFVIARIGCFFELECQEWQKAVYSVGGTEVKKWSLQLRRSVSDGMPPSSNGTSLQQEMTLVQERTLPSSPGSLYSPHSKSSVFMKGSLGQASARKQLMGGHAVVENSRGLIRWVQSISFVSVSIDHSLRLVFQADSTSSGTTQGSGISAQPGYLEGYTPVKSLGSTSASYIVIPSPDMHFLPPAPLQLPTCLTAESPPLAHLLHSKGSAIPLSTGFVVSKAVPTMRKDARSISNEEWPSILSVSLVDYYGGNNVLQDKTMKGIAKFGGRGLSSETREIETEAHVILESVAAELHALSWMTVSPAYLDRRSALPFHCDMVLRLRRLLHFADKELSRQPEKSAL